MTPEEREARILSLAAIVLAAARGRKCAVPRYVSFDDLLSCAWLGAIQAVDHFEPARDKHLSMYARFRINGAMRDYLRSLDPLTRGQRAEVNRGEAQGPVTYSLGVDRSYEREGGEKADAITLLIDKRSAARHRAHEARMTLEPLYEWANLKPRNARILKRCYEGQTMKEVGVAFHLHESRISQICKQQIEKLRLAA